MNLQNIYKKLDMYEYLLFQCSYREMGGRNGRILGREQARYLAPIVEKQQRDFVSNNMEIEDEHPKLSSDLHMRTMTHMHRHMYIQMPSPHMCKQNYALD